MRQPCGLGWFYGRYNQGQTKADLPKSEGHGPCLCHLTRDKDSCDQREFSVLTGHWVLCLLPSSSIPSSGPHVTRYLLHARPCPTLRNWTLSKAGGNSCPRGVLTSHSVQTAGNLALGFCRLRLHSRGL